MDDDDDEDEDDIELLLDDMLLDDELLLDEELADVYVTLSMGSKPVPEYSENKKFRE